MNNIVLKLKYGFTLAEVLITLVIIGVIAAMTIPTLINKTQDQEFKSQFSKAFSTVSQAIYKTETNDFYGYAKCYYPKPRLDGMEQYYPQDCSSFFSKLIKNLQVQKICNNNALSGGCVPVYDYTPNGGCSGFSKNSIENTDKAIVLSNGQIIIPYTLSDTTYPLFLIDINGQKGPNAYGKDLFAFLIFRDVDAGMYAGNDGRCDAPVSGGRTTEEMIKYSLAGIK